MFHNKLISFILHFTFCFAGHLLLISSYNPHSFRVLQIGFTPTDNSLYPAKLDVSHRAFTMLLGRSMRRFNRFHAFMVVAGLLFITLVVYHRADTNADGYDTKDATMRNAHVKNSHMRNRDGEANDNADTNDATDLVHYRRETPLIWIGGVPRSGTTLMRAMLDAHEDVRCGEETRVIPRVLGMHAGMTKSELEMTRLKEAHIDENVLNSALGAYILSIIALHGEPASRLCNKDPFTLRSMSRLSTIFPNSKYLLMIRDGRATAHSIISRKVTIKGFDIKTYRGALKDWNRAIESMYNECQKAGEDTCLPVHYEQLVLHPESQMRRISEFLDLPWDENVLHHEKMVGGEVSLSK